jgi:hypothetical protein
LQFLCGGLQIGLGLGEGGLTNGELAIHLREVTALLFEDGRLFAEVLFLSIERVPASLDVFRPPMHLGRSSLQFFDLFIDRLPGNVQGSLFQGELLATTVEVLLK